MYVDISTETALAMVRERICHLEHASPNLLEEISSVSQLLGSIQYEIERERRAKEKTNV